MTNSLCSGFTEFSKYLHEFRASLVACLLLVITEHATAEDCSPHGGSLEGLPILEVTIENNDIFDLEQENQKLWIHKWANKLHINTRKKTIEEQLLFDTRDGYNENLIRETERL